LRPRRPSAPWLAGLAFAVLAMLLPAACAATEPETEGTNRVLALDICANLTEGRCQDSAKEMPADTGVLYATATVERAVEGTEALATLTRIEDSRRQKVLSYSLGIEPDEETGEALLVFFFDSSADQENGGRWQPGEYEVEVEVHAAGAEPARAAFRLS